MEIDRFEHSIERGGKQFLLFSGGRLAQDEDDGDKERVVRNVKERFGIEIFFGPAVELSESGDVVTLSDPELFGIYVEADKANMLANLYGCLGRAFTEKYSKHNHTD